MWTYKHRYKYRCRHMLIYTCRYGHMYAYTHAFPYMIQVIICYNYENWFKKN